MRFLPCWRNATTCTRAVRLHVASNAVVVVVAAVTDHLFAWSRLLQLFHYKAIEALTSATHTVTQFKLVILLTNQARLVS